MSMVGSTHMTILNLQNNFSGQKNVVKNAVIINLLNANVATTVQNVSKYGVFSGPYFPAFGLNTERHEVSLRIQSECGKIQTRKNSAFGHFSGSASYRNHNKFLNNVNFDV